MTRSSRLKTALTTALLTAMLLAASVSTALAYTLEEFTFKDAAETEEFHALIEEIRCLVCQNESLAASQADLAQDLRKEIYRMFKKGKSRDEIIEFLVARYGDFVLYDPPLKPSTYVLWFGPFVLIGFGGIVLVRTLLRKRQSPDKALSDEEQQRLRELLARAGSDRDKPQ